MSADNGVYIFRFTDGYRVAHLQNVDDYLQDDCYSHALRSVAFCNLPVFATKEEAFTQADSIYNELEICEYGIVPFNEPVFQPLIDFNIAEEIIECDWRIIELTNGIRNIYKNWEDFVNSFGEKYYNKIIDNEVVGELADIFAPALIEEARNYFDYYESHEDRNNLFRAAIYRAFQLSKYYRCMGLTAKG